MDDKTHLNIPSENIHNESFTPPGGGTPYIRDNYTKHGEILFEKALKIKRVQNKKIDTQFVDDYYVEVESPKEVKIKQAKGNLENLGFEILRYSKNNENLATARIKKSKFEEFENKVNRYTHEEGNPNKSYISFLEDLKDIPFEDKITTELNIESNEPQDIIVSLYDVLSSREKTAVLENIKNELLRNNIPSDIHTFISGLTTVACKIQQNMLKELFENYSTIREISKNHIAIKEQSMPVQDLPNPLDVQTPESKSKIGIIDSGIDINNEIFNSLVERRIPFLPHGSIDSPNDHGTFVASRCLFGDNIDNCLTDHKLFPYCRVIDIPVFGIDSTGNELSPSFINLMLALENIIPALSKDVKVYNISLGFNNSITDFAFTPLAKLLDFISNEFDVLFIISAGNITSQLGDFPKDHFENIQSRICSPAESILAISVGSIAKFENDNSLSLKNQLSPFSRIGPGADKGIKPEVLTHGGNLSRGYSQLPRLSTYGISKDGIKLSVDVGTSFSAPIVAQYAQKLFDLYPNSDTNLVKALLFHFSDPIIGFEDVEIDPLHLCGFGEPNIQAALFSSSTSGTYIYEGELELNNYQFVKFHVPGLLSSDNPNSKLKIKTTLVYNPIVNQDNDLEYSCARISLSLIKPTNEGNRIISLTGDDNYNLPWNPIIRCEKSFSRNYAVGEWFLRMRLYTRNLKVNNYKQKYAVVIEIVDEKGNVDVYSEIINEFKGIYRKIILRKVA